MSAMEVFLSIDVECVATGRGHLDRTPVSVAIVDASEAVLFQELIKPGCVVYSYLTELTGFRVEHLVSARSSTEVMIDLKSRLGPNVVLVGQGIENDIRWLQLRRGIDYKSFVDLAVLFTTDHKKDGVVKPISYSLQHVAQVCLPDYDSRAAHTAVHDARTSIQLFKMSGGPLTNQKKLRAMKHALRQAPRPPRSVLAASNFRLGDVCCAGYSTSCACGQPSIKLILASAEGEYPYPFPVVAPPPSAVVTATSTPPARSTPPAVVSARAVASACTSTGAPAAASASRYTSSDFGNYPISYSTMRETMERGGGRFNPHVNYDDDHDQLYGDFYGNSGGKD